MSATFDQRFRRLLRRFFTSAGNQIEVAVTATATDVDVEFARSEVDANYGVVATPNWDTTIWVTDKLTSGCTINFGTAAPANAVVDLITFRSE